MNVRDIIEKKVNLPHPDEGVYTEVKNRWDSVAKPLDSMGRFEEFICKIGAVQESSIPRLDRAAMLIFCADNGIVEENISQSDQSVTALCVKSISAGKSCMGIMASREKIDIITVDVGVNSDEEFPLAVNKKVARGTKNFLKEKAMTEDEMFKALQAGFDMVKVAKKKGYQVIGLGEMGIGNTTTSSAMAAALLNLPAKEVTGRGAGLSNAGLDRKIKVIDDALEKYQFESWDNYKILSSVGGFDIAAMAGACIGAAFYMVPVVLDGFISMVAALVAQRLVPGVKEYMIPSHESREKAAGLIAKELGLTPVINADMALGEGSGAVLMISLLKTALLVLSESNSFADIKVENYERFDKK